jgi:hypothetical protein
VVTFLVAGALTALNVWTLGAVRARLVLSERYDDLLNNVLEARRYEKNVLIYGDVASLAEGMDYLDQAQAQARALAADMARVTGPEQAAELQAALAGYRAVLADLGRGATADAERIRAWASAWWTWPRPRPAPSASASTAPSPGCRSCPSAPWGVSSCSCSSSSGWWRAACSGPSTWCPDHRRVARATSARGRARAAHRRDRRLLEALDRMARELLANQENLLQARKIAALGTLPRASPTRSTTR